MHKAVFSTIAFLLYLLVVHSPLQAQDSIPELGIDEHLDTYLPKDLVFTDENYNPFHLTDSIHLPTVIALVYYDCPGICTPLLEGLSDVVNRSDMTLGIHYQVITVSFNPEEKPSLARNKKNTFAKLVPNQDVEHHWKYLTGDQENISRLLNSIGYKIKKEGKEFIHPAAIVVVSPDGKITRYLHGIYFLPFDFKMAIVEASRGKSGPTINKVLQFCFSYDPEGKKYVLNITRISGTIILLGALTFFLFMILRRRKKPTNPN